MSSFFHNHCPHLSKAHPPPAKPFQKAPPAGQQVQHIRPRCGLLHSRGGTVSWPGTVPVDHCFFPLSTCPHMASSASSELLWLGCHPCSCMTSLSVSRRLPPSQPLQQRPTPSPIHTGLQKNGAQRGSCMPRVTVCLYQNGHWPLSPLPLFPGMGALPIGPAVHTMGVSGDQCPSLTGQQHPPEQRGAGSGEP